MFKDVAGVLQETNLIVSGSKMKLMRTYEAAIVQKSMVLLASGKNASTSFSLHL